MFDLGDINRLLHPLKKGIWFIIVALLVATIATNKLVDYQNPMYESELRVHLDDKEKGFGQNNLFKDFDVFITTNQILTEVEILKSELIIKNALKTLDFDVTYYRKGDIRTAETYHQSPFRVLYSPDLVDNFFNVAIHNDSTYTISHNSYQYTGKFNNEINIAGGKVTLLLQDNIVDKIGTSNLIGQYHFRTNSLKYLIDHEIRPFLFVKEIDKDIPIIRIIFQSEVPEKTALFANALAQSYLDNYVGNKTKAAGLTGTFLQQKLKEVEDQLNDTELALERYRLKHHIINTRQETETGLRQLSQLQVQLINIEMTEASLDSLKKYISTDKATFLNLAPSFEDHGGLLFTELVKKLKALEDDKKRLLARYRPSSDEIQLIDAKINSVVSYIQENIVKHVEKVKVQKQQILKYIEQVSHEFDELPSVEKKYVQLQRDFSQKQELFTFLSKKHAEANIATTADICFHRVIQEAIVPKKPYSPKRKFQIVISGFMAILVSTFLVYVIFFFKGKVTHKDQLAKWSSMPIAGIIRKGPNNIIDIENMLTAIGMAHSFEKGTIITLNSYNYEEGKSLIGQNLVQCLLELGKKVLLVHMDSGAFTFYNTSACLGPSPLQKKQLGGGLMERIPGEYKSLADIIVIDSVPISGHADALPVLKTGHINLLVIKYNATKVYHLRLASSILGQYNVQGVKLVFNGVPNSYNYLGRRISISFILPIKYWLKLLRIFQTKIQPK